RQHVAQHPDAHQRYNDAQGRQCDFATVVECPDGRSRNIRWEAYLGVMPNHPTHVLPRWNVDDLVGERDALLGYRVHRKSRQVLRCLLEGVPRLVGDGPHHDLAWRKLDGASAPQMVAHEAQRLLEIIVHRHQGIRSEGRYQGPEQWDQPVEMAAV